MAGKEKYLSRSQLKKKNELVYDIYRLYMCAHASIYKPAHYLPQVYRALNRQLSDGISRRIKNICRLILNMRMTEDSYARFMIMAEGYK